MPVIAAQPKAGECTIAVAFAAAAVAPVKSLHAGTTVAIHVMPVIAGASETRSAGCLTTATAAVAAIDRLHLVTRVTIEIIPVEAGVPKAARGAGMCEPKRPHDAS